MNEKLNIQDLIDTLAERHGMSKKNADSFVKEFFQLIEEALENERYVKIRGLGTFKLINVGSRESVNVNTGERIEIQEHTKVSFTPEPALKDIINKPFSHFETVALNDTAVFEDTLQENDSEEDDDDAEIKTPEQEVEEKVEPAAEEKIAVVPDEVAVATDEIVIAADEVAVKEIAADEIAAKEVTAKDVTAKDVTVKDVTVKDVAVKEAVTEKPALMEETTIEETLVETVTEEPTAAPEPEIKEEKTEKTEPEVMPENVVAAEPEPSGPVAKDAADSLTMRYFIGIVVFVVLLCGGAVAFMYYPDLLDGLSAKPLAEEVADSDGKESVTEKVNVPAGKDAGKDNSALADSIVSKDVVIPVRTDSATEIVAATTPALKETPKENVQAQSPAPKKEQKKTAVPFEPDSVEYMIVGTETTYTIKEGETLTKVALRFYGTKALWPYIVKHNPDVIKNPDNVPYGTTVKIPKLAKKQ